MGILFFIISFLYSFVFYVFYSFSKGKDLFFSDLLSDKEVINRSLFDSIILSSESSIILQSFFGNLLIETLFFFILGLILLFYFSSISIQEEKKVKEISKHSILDDIFTKDNLIKISKKFSFYIGFLLFYLSFYLISLGIDFINFSFFVFLLSLLVIGFFYISKYSDISRKFLRINSILFSFTYIFSYIYIIITSNNFFGYLDFLNSFLIIFTFLFLIYFNKRILLKERHDKVLITHFTIYLFFVLLFYSYHYLFGDGLLFWITILSSIFGFVLFEALPKIKILKNDKLILKYLGIFFTYLSVFFSILYLLIYGFNIIIIIISGLYIYYNYFIHKKYTNYISLGFSILLFIFTTNFLLINFDLINYKGIYFLLIGLIISYILIGITYFKKFKSVIDIYLFHFISYIVNIGFIINYLIFNYSSFTFVTIGLLLLTESIYFFISYNKLHSNKK